VAQEQLRTAVVDHPVLEQRKSYPLLVLLQLVGSVVADLPFSHDLQEPIVALGHGVNQALQPRCNASKHASFRLFGRDTQVVEVVEFGVGVALDENGQDGVLKLQRPGNGGLLPLAVTAQQGERPLDHASQDRCLFCLTDF